MSATVRRPSTPLPALPKLVSQRRIIDETIAAGTTEGGTAEVRTAVTGARRTGLIVRTVRAGTVTSDATPPIVTSVNTFRLRRCQRGSSRSNWMPRYSGTCAVCARRSPTW
jgi:hypothetical protein